MKTISFLSGLLANVRAVLNDRRGCLPLIVAALFLLSAVARESSASPTDIVMRFIDGNTGKPLVGVQVQVDAWRVDASNPKSEKLLVTWNRKTDKDGKVLVHLQEPIPEHLSYDSPNELRECSHERFSVHDAIRYGVLANYREKCGKLNAVATAAAGEIVIFDRKYKFLD